MSAASEALAAAAALPPRPAPISTRLVLEIVDADGTTISTTEYATAADLWAALYPRESA